MIISSKRDNLKLLYKMFEEIPQYIQPGVFFYSRYPRPFFYQRKYKAKKFIDLLYQDFIPRRNYLKFMEYYAKRLINLLLYKKIIFHPNMNEPHDTFQGSLIMPLNRGKQVKIFCFDARKVITYYSDFSDLEATAEVIDIVPNQINSTVDNIIKKDSLIVEDLILYTPFELLKSKQIFSAFNKYNSDLKNVIIQMDYKNFQDFSTDLVIGAFTENVFSPELKSLVSEQFNLNSLIKKLPTIRMFEYKSDLKFNNIIIKDEDYYLIDFQGTSMISILAVFFAHKNDLLYNFSYGNLILDYKHGGMDKYFKAVFKKFNDEFDSSLRDEYYFLSLLNPKVNYKELSEVQINNMNESLSSRLKIYLEL